MIRKIQVKNKSKLILKRIKKLIPLKISESFLKNIFLEIVLILIKKFILNSRVEPENKTNQIFKDLCAKKVNPSVLEIGTKRSIIDRPTMHKDWVPHAKEYLGCDIENGIDVDIVCDVHKLSETLGVESFDVIITCSGFEHFKYPHLAAHEIMKVLSINGVLFIQTHQSFPIHAYPYDYFRFSKQALEGLFGAKMGVEIIESSYEFPCSIVSSADKFGALHEAYLNSCIVVKKISKTPDKYIYELDH